MEEGNLTELIKGIIPLGFLFVATWQLFPEYIGIIIDIMIKITFGVFAFLVAPHIVRVVRNHARGK